MRALEFIGLIVAILAYLFLLLLLVLTHLGSNEKLRRDWCRDDSKGADDE